MSIWGVGYGVNPKFVHNPKYLIENGVPNVLDYGNLLPAYHWYTLSGKIYINGMTGTDYTPLVFSLPITENHTILKVTGVQRFTEEDLTLLIGSNPGSGNLFYTDLQSGLNTFNISHITAPYYIGFYIVGSHGTAANLANLTLE